MRKTPGRETYQSYFSPKPSKDCDYYIHMEDDITFTLDHVDLFANSIDLDFASLTLSTSLDNSLQDLGQLYKKSELSSHQMDDYVDSIKYCAALITVLEAYTVIDYTDLRVKLNKYEDRLREIF